MPYYRPFGEKNVNWKGGISLHHSSGYIMVLKYEDGKRKYVLQHRLIYEEYYKVCLLRWTDVHHINGNKHDNRIENLIAMMHVEHTRMNNKTKPPFNHRKK
jgi:hypothetical protein